MLWKMIYSFFLVILASSCISCSGGSVSDTTDADNPEEQWLIPRNEIADGGPGKDGIPALTDPSFVSASEAVFMDEGDLVIGVRVDDDVRAYPHSILDWHEIVNDTVGEESFAITYCPLTGTGIGWNRDLWGETTTFGVSGLLYNSNLILYDRSTDSNWSQMLGRCVNGEFSGEDIETIRVLETTWGTWKTLFPQTKVVSRNTGYARNYGNYPYGNYRSDDTLLFSVSRDDTRLHRKERVHGVLVDDRSRVYPIMHFPDTFLTINDTVNGQEIVVVGNAAMNLVASYERVTDDGTVLTFEPLSDMLPAVMEDSEGTRWDILGKGIEGPREGDLLGPTMSFNAYWFAWAAFFGNAEIHLPAR